MSSDNREQWLVSCVVLLCLCLAMPSLGLAQPEDEGGDCLQSRAISSRVDVLQARVRNSAVSQLLPRFGEGLLYPGFGSFSNANRARLVKSKACVLRVRNARVFKKYGLKVKVGDRLRITNLKGRLSIAQFGKSAKGIILRKSVKGIQVAKRFKVGRLAKKRKKAKHAKRAKRAKAMKDKYKQTKLAKENALRKKKSREFLAELKRLEAENKASYQAVLKSRKARRLRLKLLKKAR